MPEVAALYIASAAAAAPVAQQAVRAVPGHGLEGDRYFVAKGTFSPKLHRADHELTLVEEEKVTDFNLEYGRDLSPGDIRRNVVTRGVSLNDLVGREFRVGEVHVRGIRLCEPCSHLARLADPLVLPGLKHKAGLRAQILTEGWIRVGDAITMNDECRRPNDERMTND